MRARAKTRAAYGILGAIAVGGFEEVLAEVGLGLGAAVGLGAFLHAGPGGELPGPADLNRFGLPFFRHVSSWSAETSHTSPPVPPPPGGVGSSFCATSAK